MRTFALIPLLLIAGCQSGSDGELPGDRSDNRPFSAIAGDEVLKLTGTEPFWGGTIDGSTLTYATPENGDGETVPVERFAGRGGLSFSGKYRGQGLDLMITPGSCSDGMSDRTYPFVATLLIGAETRNGCAWSDRHPFTGPDRP